ncbi:hypothetical protein AB205_0175790 [Aquarana catesbeiana]|uniref:Uncharacterized protein n=1 Tax=Aquarana catesbeiana TaxID=8400 RepID=A0A2G9SAK1_AQUCT|nr:hypothetical protein AB205_0175790 [Aquarana catesbeiana]
MLDIGADRSVRCSIGGGSLAEEEEHQTKKTGKRRRTEEEAGEEEDWRKKKKTGGRRRRPEEEAGEARRRRKKTFLIKDFRQFCFFTFGCQPGSPLTADDLSVVKDAAAGFPTPSLATSYIQHKKNTYRGKNVAILHQEGHMDDGVTLQKCQHEESQAARIIRNTTGLFSQFIRILD